MTSVTPDPDSVDALEPEPSVQLTDSALYFNREVSWLDFNDRVLQLVEDATVPLLERVKFCAIYTSNLDEFFMVRVAGLHDQLEAGIDARGPDGVSAGEAVDTIKARVGELGRRQIRCLENELVPGLAEAGIRIASIDDVSDHERRELDARFRRQIFPVLTPLAVGLGRPFPYISNLSLSLAVLVRDPVSGHETFARVKVPKEMLPRFVPVGEGLTFVPMEQVIAANLDALFPGMEILDYDYFKVTRDADFTVSDEADDLLQAVEHELRRRRFGEIVRVEIGSSMNAGLRDQLVARLRAQGVEAEDNNLLVSYGSGQILALLPQVFVDPGDVVVIEGPSFMGAVRQFSAAGARLVTVPTDAQGMDVEAL